MTCPLCEDGTTFALPRGRDGRGYRRCATCDLYFLEPGERLDAGAERARYDLHTHDHADAGYARFTAPLVGRVRDLVSPGGRGLDFGAGRVPVLARRLARDGFDVAIFDAVYHPDARVWRERYDFVIACEVIEHLYDPAAEFARLRAALRPGARLFVMTDVRRDEVDFDGWSYRRDPTHVAFFSADTFRWIARAFGFKNVEIASRVIVLNTPGG